MSRKSRSTFVVCLLAVCMLICLPAFGQKSTLGGPGPSPVLVVNGTGAPVPVAPQGTTNVAGTVNVGNTPSVNIANTPSVSITGSPTVTLAPGASTGVTNPLDNQGNAIPLAITEGAQFYSVTCNGQFNGASGTGCNFPTVPSHKLLVIQEVDADIRIDTGVRPQTIFVNIDTVYHYFTDTFMATFDTSDFYATHQSTHIYAGPGQTPGCNVLSNSNGSVNGYINCGISGFLVDQP